MFFCLEICFYVPLSKSFLSFCQNNFLTPFYFLYLPLSSFLLLFLCQNTPLFLCLYKTYQIVLQIVNKVCTFLVFFCLFCTLNKALIASS